MSSSQSQPCADAGAHIPRSHRLKAPSGEKRAKLTERITLHMDADTRKRLSGVCGRLRVHHAELLRAFIARGLQQAEAARDA